MSAYLEAVLLVSFVFIPLGGPFITMFGVYYHLDPLYFPSQSFYAYMWPTNYPPKFGSWSQIYILLIRIYITHIVTTTSMHLFLAPVLILVIISVNTKHSLSCISQVQNPQIFLQIYTEFYLASVTFEYDLIMPVLASLMLAGLVLGIMSNFCTIALYSHIAMPYYLCFPILGVFIAIVVHVTMPVGANVYEDSLKLLGEREKVFAEMAVVGFGTSKKGKIWAKKCASLRPISVSAGLLGCNFFTLKSSTRTVFYTEYVQKSIDALLSIKVH